MDCSWTLPLTAFTLGLRHGVDWDHIAAISDLVATPINVEGREVNSSSNGIFLAIMYALGHAAAIVLLGVCAMYLKSILPIWIDPVMDFLVGATLIILGLSVFWSMMRQIKAGEGVQLQHLSRGHALWSFFRQLSRRAGMVASGDYAMSVPAQFGSLGAVAVGVIHGVSAETGTQTLLIAGVGGAQSHGLGLLMLASFVGGLLISNSIIAVTSASRFCSKKLSKALLLPVSLVTAVFSICVGVVFVTGMSSRLPDPAQFVWH